MGQGEAGLAGIVLGGVEERFFIILGPLCKPTDSWQAFNVFIFY